MIELVRLKRALAVVAVLLAALASVVVLRQAGAAVLQAATGADPSAAFTEIPPAPAEVRGAIGWLPDPDRDGRPMEPATRDRITDSYARALAALDRAGRGDPSAPLGDYLSGPALEEAIAVVEAVDHVPVDTTHVRHDLRLDFYSDDGSIVAIAVPHAEIVRSITSAGGAMELRSTEWWRLVMLLEDGNWRLHQLDVAAVGSIESAWVVTS